MDKEYILELFEKYRSGQLKESDLTEDQKKGISQIYDKKIRELKAHNRSRVKAIGAQIDAGLVDLSKVGLIEEKLQGVTISMQGKTFDKFYLQVNPAGNGMDLFDGVHYIATYLTYEDCLCDLSFHLSIINFDTIINMFVSQGVTVLKPYRYRGVCSELYLPLDKVNRYVFYSNSLQDIFEKFDTFEQRAVRSPEYFQFGVQGVGIHLFDENELKYRLWLGGSNIASIPDVIRIANREKKFIPNEVFSELTEINKVDVFISHKSDDFLVAKRVYDYLVSKGISTFLSEMSLPALSNADYSAEIDKALDNANNIIVIATSREKVEAGWVKYEWSTFANEKRSGRKNGNIITLIVDGMRIDDLPLLLRQYEVIPIGDFTRVEQYII